MFGVTSETFEMKNACYLLHAGFFLAYSSTLKMVATCSSKISVDFTDYIALCESRDSDWLRAGRPRGRRSNPGRVKNFYFSMSSKPAVGSTQPPMQWVTGALSPGVKRPGREADHSTRISVEVKKTWIYTSTPPYAIMEKFLIS
jgi:hypothetical protein